MAVVKQVIIIQSDSRYAAEGRNSDGYERAMVEQARSIVSGQCCAMPSHEHLRVLLHWLDGGAVGVVPRTLH